MSANALYLRLACLHLGVASERLRRYAWDEAKHPRQGKGSDKGGEFIRKVHPHVGAASLLKLADSIDADADQSLHSWILLGQTERYSEEKRRAAKLRQAAGITSVAARRQFLRDNVETIKLEFADEGVWRTIRGRKVLIREGESLESAMARAGIKDERKEHPTTDEPSWELVKDAAPTSKDHSGLPPGTVVSKSKMGTVEINRGQRRYIARDRQGRGISTHNTVESAKQAVQSSRAAAGVGGGFNPVDKSPDIPWKDFAWDESKHPRQPSGSDKGGEFAPKAARPTQIEHKETDLARWPHLKATGKGRVVRGPDGLIAGYIKTKANRGAGFAPVGSLNPGGSRHQYVYHGVDGRVFTRDTLEGVANELRINPPPPLKRDFAWDESKYQRGKTTEKSRGGSFAPKVEGMTPEDFMTFLKSQGHELLVTPYNEDAVKALEGQGLVQTRTISAPAGSLLGTKVAVRKTLVRLPDMPTNPYWEKYAAWDEGKHPRHPSGSDKGGEFMPKGDLYHVTETKNLKSIRKEGLVPFKPSNWLRAGTRERYGSGETYVFENPQDAIRWAFKMDWEFNKATGSGKVSIVRLRPDGRGWEIDTSDPLTQSSAAGKWLKRIGGVKASQIVGSQPFTPEMAKASVARQNEWFRKGAKS